MIAVEEHVIYLLLVGHFQLLLFFRKSNLDLFELIFQSNEFFFYFCLGHP